jgi:alkylation response protein AidB-like acyl-CoA dehydrogenase
LRRVDVAADPSSAVRAAARRALAHELLGVTESMLELTVTHVTGRIQYGRAIGAFQAVQHRMADVQVALDAARAVTSAAWRNGDSLTCDAAKALAGRAALLASKHCQQVVGAIGFTAEHPLPRHISRAHVLDALYGSASAIQERIGEQLLDHRAAFRLPPAWAGD